MVTQVWHVGESKKSPNLMILETAGAPTLIFAMSSVRRMQASEPKKVQNSLFCSFHVKR